MSGARTKLSTAVRPFGQPKTMPLVVHTGGNTLYEEPCLAYLHLHVTKVPHAVSQVAVDNSYITPGTHQLMGYPTTQNVVYSSWQKSDTCMELKP